MKSMTGVGENDHVTANDFRNMLVGICGPGSYILNTGEKFATQLVSNNQLDIGTGMMCHEGHLSTEVEGSSIVIANGAQGMKRIDLIVNRYQRDDVTQVETNSWVYIMGTADASNPVTPEYTEGSIMAGDLIVDCPVFEIHLEGLNITNIKCLVPVIKTSAEIQREEIGEIKEQLNNQIVSYTNKIELINSRYFNLDNSVLKYNRVTGEVSIIVYGHTLEDLAAGQIVYLGYVAKTFAPKEISVPIHVSATPTSGGAATAILYRVGLEYERRMRAFVTKTIKKGYYLYAETHYYIEPGLV